MDTKDWDGFAAVFAPDAVIGMRSEVPPSDEPDAGLTPGNEAIAEFVRSHIGDVGHGAPRPHARDQADVTNDGAGRVGDR